MIRDDTRLIVDENSDPLKRIRVWVVANNGTRTAYDFTGVDQIDFYGKAAVDTPLADAFIHYQLTVPGEITVEDPPTAGTVAVQFVAADLAIPGTFRFRMDVIKVGRRTPVAAGFLIVRNL